MIPTIQKPPMGQHPILITVKPPYDESKKQENPEKINKNNKK
jgi:hypothetical protein